jgi:predicted O-methyltransferase YrrM
MSEFQMVLCVTMSSRLRGYLREYGIRDTVDRALCKATSRVLRSGFRKRDVPSLGELSAQAESVHVTAEDMLCTVLSVRSNDLGSLREEFSVCAQALKQRYVVSDLPYETSFAVEEGSAFLLYSLIRSLKPKVILETGVANGHSSSVMLWALSKNGCGELHSIDLSEDVGRLISPEQKSQWHLHLLDSSGLKKSYLSMLAALPAVDMMIHDSDHSYQWMRFELEGALPRMSKNGVIACDDVHICYGMLDFCRAHEIMPRLLMDKRKIFGLVQLTESHGLSANL